jgi:NADPH:quinone reductase-like Zn-dependent oxidoreductase
MKAVLFRSHGGPEVLEHADVPEPVPGPGELLIRVKACALNHLDIWIRQGIPAYRITLPHISGCDVSGLVERAGGSSSLTPGQRVVLAPQLSCGRCDACRRGDDPMCPSFGIRGAAVPGGYAELTLAKESEAFPIPDALPFEEAAAFPLVFLTAWHMLVGRAKLQAGERVLIHGAGSGVGHAAVQIAKHLKAVVYATVGQDDKIAKATALGADEVINYRHASFEERVKALTDGRGVEVVLDHIGPEVWEGSIRSLAKGGRLVTCGATSGPAAPLDLRYLYSRQLTLLGSMMGGAAEFRAVAELVNRRVLRPVIDRVFPLAQARQAQEHMLSRRFFGKIVLAA